MYGTPMCISTVVASQIQPLSAKSSVHVYEMFLLFFILLPTTFRDVQDTPVHHDRNGDDGISNQV